MRIALVFSGCHRRAGVERSMWEAARTWRTHHDVTVIAADVDLAGLEGVDVRTVRPAGGGPKSFSAAARPVIEDGDFDDVVSFGALDVPATILWVNSVHRAWLEASRRFPGSGLERFPSLRYLSPGHRERLRLERSYFVGTSARRVVCVADQVGRDLTRLYGVPAERVLTVPNGFDPTEFDPARTHRERQAARDTFDLPADAFVVCMAANELPRKGFDVLVRAAAAVEDPRVHILLVGRADPGRYTQLIERCGLHGRVHWGGLQSDVGLAHAASDVFALPTKYEAFCLAIVEALASGLPVITSGASGAHDLINDDQNGRVVADPTDHLGVAAALRQALDPATLARWSEQARPSVANLAWPIVLDRAQSELFAQV